MDEKAETKSAPKKSAAKPKKASAKPKAAPKPKKPRKAKTYLIGIVHNDDSLDIRGPFNSAAQALDDVSLDAGDHSVVLFAESRRGPLKSKVSISR